MACRENVVAAPQTLRLTQEIRPLLGSLKSFTNAALSGRNKRQIYHRLFLRCLIHNHSTTTSPFKQITVVERCLLIVESWPSKERPKNGVRMNPRQQRPLCSCNQGSRSDHGSRQFFDMPNLRLLHFGGIYKTEILGGRIWDDSGMPDGSL